MSPRVLQSLLKRPSNQRDAFRGPIPIPVLAVLKTKSTCGEGAPCELLDIPDWLFSVPFSQGNGPARNGEEAEEP
jgi:hypothetical protein